jgi:hypothetical protein
VCVCVCVCVCVRARVVVVMVGSHTHTHTHTHTHAPSLCYHTNQDYGTAANFSKSIQTITVHVDAAGQVLTQWRGRTLEFTPGPSTWKGEWTLPTVDGVAVDIDPPFLYVNRCLPLQPIHHL